MGEIISYFYAKLVGPSVSEFKIDNPDPIKENKEDAEIADESKLNPFGSSLLKELEEQILLSPADHPVFFVVLL